MPELPDKLETGEQVRMAHLRKVEEVVWLEDPNNYDYLREVKWGTCRRSGKPGCSFGKIIGYENLKKKGKGIQAYTRRVWYLKPHDKGMPKCDKYEKEGFRPTEAVEPENIRMPPDVKVIKRYEEEQVVPEVKNTEEKNEAWREAEKKEKPFLVLEIKRKYATINYDMYTTLYNLTEEARDKLIGCFKEYWSNKTRREQKRALKKGATNSFGTVSGFIQGVRIHEARELVKKMKDIILDEGNWEAFFRSVFRKRAE